MADIQVVHEDLNYRLKQVIKKYFGNQKQMAKEMGFSASNITDWWGGRSKPTATILLQICELTGVSMDWLVLGRAEPYLDETLFNEVFNKAVIFTQENNIKFDANLLLGILRITIAEKRAEQDISLSQILTKYKEIIISLRKDK
ncbi:Helix-turn-helix domain-containing protein [Candidatus Hepatincolaceae symbiont of Richtersius coronifer]